MNGVEEYIISLPNAKREICLYLHALFIEQFKLIPKIKHKIPFYYKNKWVLYLNPENKKGVELAFINGYLLDEKQTLIESKGRKMVKSVEFLNLKNIPEKEIIRIVKYAL